MRFYADRTLTIRARAEHRLYVLHPEMFFSTVAVCVRTHRNLTPSWRFDRYQKACRLVREKWIAGRDQSVVQGPSCFSGLLSNV